MTIQRRTVLPKHTSGPKVLDYGTGESPGMALTQS